MAERVCVGQIGAPHGVRGLVLVRPFTEEPGGVVAYGPVTTEAGQLLTLDIRSAKKGGVIVAIEGVETREAAAALNGQRLYVERASLPEPGEEEYYHADLVGLRAETQDGTLLGTVSAIHDFGAGDVIEIASGGDSFMIAFSRAAVPSVDLAGGRIVVAPDALVPETDA